MTKRALGGIVVVVAVVGLTYATISNRERSLVKYADQMRTDAVQKHPDLPVTVAMQQEAGQRFEEKMAAAASGQKRANLAADSFWGFYFINARSRLDFCREQGVDIQSFVDAFERGHTTQVATARAIYARSQTDENWLYSQIKDQVRKVIIQDMNDMATSNGISAKEACQLIADNAEDFAREMHVSKRVPALFQALSSVK
jgi:hypothetical protein